MDKFKESIFQQIIIQYQLIIDTYENDKEDADILRARYNAKIAAFVASLKIYEETNNG